MLKDMFEDLMGSFNKIVLIPVIAHKVLVTAESIPPDTPITKLSIFPLVPSTYCFSQLTMWSITLLLLIMYLGYHVQ